MTCPNEISKLAHRAAEALVQRGATIAVAESAAGGLISAALLAVPGASSYFLGGVVAYTKSARLASLGIEEADLAGMRPATEPFVAAIARRIRERHGAIWGIAESGAAGPTGNRYGDPAGHACIAIDGPVARTMVLRTGHASRLENMHAFTAQALEFLANSVTRTPND